MTVPDSAARSEAARVGAYSRWASTADRTAATQAMRDALRAKFDPGPDIPEPQRTKMIEAGLRAHMARMRLARRRKRKTADELVEDILQLAEPDQAS